MTTNVPHAAPSSGPAGHLPPRREDWGGGGKPPPYVFALPVGADVPIGPRAAT